MNGRLDNFGGRLLVVLALVSVSGPVFALGGSFATYDEAYSACVSDLTSAHDALGDTNCGNAGKDNLCGYYNECGGEADGSGVGNYLEEKWQSNENWQSPGGYRSGEKYFYLWGEEPDCDPDETIQGDFAGEGLSVCTGGCSYTTTAGINSEDGTGSALVHETRYTDKPTYRAGYWENTGDSCETGVAPEDGITASGGTTLAFEQDQPNCGTVNGERFCAESIPDTGKCTLLGTDGYVCGARGELPVVPDYDPSTSTVNEVDALTIDGILGEGSALTVSSGTIDDTTPSDGLDEGSDTPTAGSGDAEDQAEDQEESKLCKEAPHLCDGEIPDEVPDVETPSNETDISDLVGPGDYPNVITDAAVCPEPETITMPDGMGGGTIEMPYTAFCDFATYINPLIVSLSYLAAFFIGIRILI